MTDEVIEDVAQLLLRPDPVDAFGVARPRWRGQLQGRVRKHDRDTGTLRTTIDLAPGNCRQAGHFRIGVEPGLLFDDGDHRADVLRCGIDVQRCEAGIDVGDPTRSVSDVARHQTIEQGVRLGRPDGRLFDLGSGAASGEHDRSAHCRRETGCRY